MALDLVVPNLCSKDWEVVGDRTYLDLLGFIRIYWDLLGYSNSIVIVCTLIYFMYLHVLGFIRIGIYDICLLVMAVSK